MLVTANILRNMLTITNNLIIPLIIGEVIVIADACLDVAFFDFGYFTFSDTIPYKENCDKENNLTHCGQDGAVNNAQWRDKKTRNN